LSNIIKLIDGEGGRATSRLVRELFLARFGNPLLEPLNDSAIADYSGKLAFTTDGFVVDPLEFPGGDIGKLAVCGTVNDLAAAGARPIMLSAAFILEEGLEIARLKKYVDSMAAAADEAQVPIACGDTKVVPRGNGDGLYITTAGVGSVFVEPAPSPRLICSGDTIVISGPIAQHAATVVAVREELHTDGYGNSSLKSDCAPLSEMVLRAAEAIGEIHAMRDPTRGGLGGILIELAQQAGKKFIIEEATIPVEKPVENICELYGYDPLFMACEGRMVFIIHRAKADKLIKTLSAHRYGRDARKIGRVEDGEGVVLITKSGGKRRLVPPEGAPLPRIC